MSNGINLEKVPGTIFMFDKNTLRGSRQMASCSIPLSIQRLLSSPCTARIITTVILVVALSGILSACIRVHIDLATNNGTAVPHATPPESVPDEKNLDGATKILDAKNQCNLKSQVPNARQQTGSWCWAASSQLVVEYLKKQPTRQCELVSQTFENTLRESTGQLTGPFLGCCEYLDGNPDASNLGGTCDQGGWPEWILEKQGIAYTKYESSEGQRLDWAGLTQQICDDHPFIFVVQWSGGGRHSAVGEGYHKTEHFGNFVEVYDHSPSGFYAMPYQEFLGHKGGFRHEFGYIDIQLKPQ